MHKTTSKRNPVASDAAILKSPDKKKHKFTNIHQSSILSCSNTAVHDFIKLNKQKISEYIGIFEIGKIYLLLYILRFRILIIFQSKNC